MSQIVSTVNVENGNSTIIGVDTLWSGNIAAGHLFTIENSGVPYTVGSVANDTILVLTAPYAGATANGETAAIVRDFTPNYDLPLLSRQDIETATIISRALEIIDGHMEQGSQGATGIQGATGMQGITGIQGIQGTQGVQGLDGAYAAQGIQGVQGPVGNTTIDSLIFTASANQTIFTLDSNPFSEDFIIITRNGVVQSPNTHYSLSGNTVTLTSNCKANDIIEVRHFRHISIVSGAQGATGVGVQGTTGQVGADGAQGVQGIQGLTGEGAQGTTGTQGATGIQGAEGVQGATGAGAQGATGADSTVQGPQGATGTTGTALDGQIVYIESGATGSNNFLYFEGNNNVRLAGSILMSDGTENEPAITFIDDESVGFFRHVGASNSFSVTAGSQECVRFSRGNTANSNTFWAMTSWANDLGPIMYVNADNHVDVDGTIASRGNGNIYLTGGEYVVLSNRDMDANAEFASLLVTRSDTSDVTLVAEAGYPTSTLMAYDQANAAPSNMETFGNWQFNNNVSITSSLGVGTAAPGSNGDIIATGTITASYSDDRLKTRFANIGDAVAKVKTLNGFYYEPNELAQSLGYVRKTEIGLSAQEVQAVLPEVVVPAPIDAQYLTIHYEKLIPLLVEAVKELAYDNSQYKAKLVHHEERIAKLERMLGLQ